MTQAETGGQTTLRGRVGMAIEAESAAKVVEKIKEAEEAGLEQVWMTQGGPVDTLTIFAAAAVQTKSIQLGTAIVPTYPRHPLTMAQQAVALNELAPGRLKLGIGPSHKPIIEGMYGIEMVKPQAHLREYMTVLRAALWEGQVDYQGDFFKVKTPRLRTAQVPLLVSALGEKAFEVAGEISDGAISWLCPVDYLINRALPAMKRGAQSHKRSTPPLVAHVLVAISEDINAIQEAGKQRLAHYTKLPFYAHMFAEAGVPVAEDGTGIDKLVETLIVQGSTAAIEERLQQLLGNGLDELLLLLVPIQDEKKERRQLQEIIGRL